MNGFKITNLKTGRELTLSAEEYAMILDDISFRLSDGEGGHMEEVLDWLVDLQLKA